MSSAPQSTRPVTLITGASGGIGADLARLFARDGRSLALVARDGEKLRSLAAEITQAGGAEPICIIADLGRPDAIDLIAETLSAHHAAPDILVNNAGFGLVGRVQSLDANEQLAILDLNIRALTGLTLRFLPQIIAVRGRILNVASVAGFIPGPGMAVYYASKAYVVSFSAALHAEIAESGASATSLCPGLTRTGFQARAGMDAAALKSLPGMDSMDVAQAGFDAVMARRARIVPGFGNKLMVAITPFIPQRLLLAVIMRLQLRRTAA